MISYNAPAEYVGYWQTIAEIGEPETVPAEIPHIGGFEFLVVPTEILPDTHATPGYDEYDDETQELSSLVLIGDLVPKHVRGLLVAHLLLHKSHPDDGSPTTCISHDKSLQSVMSDLEPSLIEPFYRESEIMYRQGKSWYEQFPGAPQLLVDRYARALHNSRERGSLSTEATEKRARLDELGIVLPDDEFALSAVNKKTGDRTTISLHTERGNRHKCRNCSHGIPKGAQRLTTSVTNPKDGRDHHHYHPGCFTHVELAVYGDFHQAEPYIPHK